MKIKKKICAGIIGSGIGIKHLEAINELKYSKVKYLCEFNNKKINLLKKKYPHIEIIKEPKKIFLDADINLVSIASYDNFHYQQIMESLKYNKNIIVEKPMCLNVRQLKIIKKNFLNKKIKIISNLVLRENNLFKKIKKSLKKREIYYIEADYIWGRKFKLFEWRSKIKNYSITLGAAIHLIDLIYWMLKKKPIFVTAYGNNIATKHSSFKSKSFAVFLFEYQDGLIAKVSANCSSVYEHFHELKIFEKNSTYVNSFKGNFVFKKNKKNKISLDALKAIYPDKRSRKNIIQNFIYDIQKNKKNSIMSLQEQIDVMSICFACDESLKENKKIRIKYV